MDGNTTGRAGALNAEGSSSVGGIGRVSGKTNLENVMTEHLDTYKSHGNPAVEPHRASLGSVKPRLFESKNSSLSLMACRRTLSSVELSIKLEGLEVDLEQVFYVDLHACQGGHLGYLQFVRYEGLRHIEGDPDFRAVGSYGLQAILLPGTPCPGPLRLLSDFYVSYEPSPSKSKTQEGQ